MHKALIVVLCWWGALSVQAQTVVFRSNNIVLEQAFAWARYRALSYAHYGADPVGNWYEAALPNREAFCMRDVSHQAIGAEILGLSKHNENMFRKFAANISPEKDYCSFWEINRYNKPAPVDYENDKDFWYNLPANFDVVHNAWRLYKWTGNKAYLDDPAMKKFYTLSMNEYVDHWDIGGKEAPTRNRSLHAAQAKRFKSHRGIPTYNEGGRGETLLGIDLTAALIAAYSSYAAMLEEQGERKQAEMMREKEEVERKFLEEFWWDSQKGEYRSIQYADQSFDHFMVGDNQAYLHYVLYFDALQDQDRTNKIVGMYRDHYKSLIVELKSYLPQIFYEQGLPGVANSMIVELCSPSNKRRDYPENSFTVIEHVTRGYMGIEPDASTKSISTLSRLETTSDWAELSRVPVLGQRVTVRHNGQVSSSLQNLGDVPVLWQACFYGAYPTIQVNGKSRKSKQVKRNGQDVSLVEIMVAPGSTAGASIN